MKHILPLLLLIPAYASAGITLIGKDAVQVKPSMYPNVCDIRIMEAYGEAQCTGTLIAPNRIVTAAHCFGREFDVRASYISVDCGPKRAQVTGVMLPDNDRWATPATPYTASDVAVLHLSKSLGVEPVSLATEREQYFDKDNLRKDVRCVVLGYGENDSGRRGALYSWNVPGENVVMEDDVIRIRNPDESVLETSVEEGDSGGLLLCTNNTTKTTQLVGVIASVGRSVETRKIKSNYMAPVWLNAAMLVPKK